MGNSRDDFTSATKELLANRVGRRCSNPACRKLTCGANTNPEKITNIGVAAHICAAAQGGPRYDASMTPEERKSFENGIWLCQSCSKLIDTDITRYPKELLQSWKQLAEQTAILEVETTSSTPAFEKDKELVQFYLECFDRPAFQDDIYQEGRMEDFDKAIEDTLIALNTGVLRTRDGSILKQADGKSSVQNSLWREKLYTITDMLGQSTWKCGLGMPPSSRSGWCTAKSTTMPRLTKFSNKNCLARAIFSSRENSFCKAMSKLYASWAFFPRSAFSTAFHRVWRSAYSGGAWDGKRMSEQITPPLRV